MVITVNYGLMFCYRESKTLSDTELSQCLVMVEDREGSDTHTDLRGSAAFYFPLSSRIRVCLSLPTASSESGLGCNLLTFPCPDIASTFTKSRTLLFVLSIILSGME
ncbi:hypothetical protein NPIL_109141 [Nephila pilipes]|uniref:Uncharacterized protein n=1 Tax=Nephila pilipes TaxID=299642 RepID=A0A8X6T0F6_NEPPI|nr:hypothetical protein NPIL_109141 [Nephila pilipes]